jgi:vancomycin resistance protein YoaR
MKNKGINDINEFKSRMKKLYEYKIHDLNLNKEEKVYHMQEDDEQNPPQQPSQEQPQQAPAPQPQAEPQPAPAPAPQQAPQPVEDNKEDMSMMSYLKTEMSKLDNVISALENISQSVEAVSSRLDGLTKVVDEIKEPSDIEKLEMRAFDSYPYNQTLTKVWGDKLKSKEEQDMDRMGVYKTDNGFEMEYTPQRNFNHVQSSNNFNNY